MAFFLTLQFTWISFYMTV